jgi:hypothetical protein
MAEGELFENVEGIIKEEIVLQPWSRRYVSFYTTTGPMFLLKILWVLDQAIYAFLRTLTNIERAWCA